MRLFRVLPVLSLLLGALASPAPEPAAHRLDMRAPGSSSLCGDVSSEEYGLVGELTQSLLSSVSVSERPTDTCLCQLALPYIIANNAFLSALAAVIGQDAVVEGLANLVCG